MATDPLPGYGIKCEPDTSYSAGYFQTPPHALQDSIPEGNEDGMDFSGLLEMDDKTLSELASGVHSGDWNSSLFNGQLDGLDILDPTTGVPGGLGEPQVPASSPPVSQSQPVDRWLMEETHKLERQQKLQQQKLLELQQTLLKTEILKNQLQIASISHSSQSHSAPPTTTSTALLSAIAGGGGTPRTNFNFPPVVTAGSIGGSGSGGGASRVALHQRGVQPAASTGSGSGEESPCDEFDIPFHPEKRKVHNLIEKKYRCSINDRIGLLRDMVSRHSKDNKRLQKSAVLQKTIDYIRHLESQLRRLQEENRALRNTLAKVTGTPRLPSFSSPPPTPHVSVSPKSLESGEDSGNPSSPDEYLSDEYPTLEPNPALHQRAKLSILASHLVHGTSRASDVSRFLMCVMLVAVFFFNPLSFIGGRGGPHHAGSMRTLSSSYSTDEIVDGGNVMDTALHFLSWAVRILIAAGCFGLMSLKSMPRIMANSRDAVHFWRFRKQAESDLQKGEFVKARENLEVALAVISRPTPTSYFGITTGLLSSILSHVFFQLVIGQWAVSLASYLVRNRGIRGYGGKMTGLGVTLGDAAETYHLLHQINLATTGGTNLHGMGFFLALNSLNFAEAARPFKLLSDQKLAEMFFSLGLQCKFSFRPYGYYLPMWFYFYRSRTVSPSQLASPLKWAGTPQGRHFLMSAQWAPEIKLGSRLYQGTAALPIYSVTRAFLKDQLQETFAALLLPDSVGGSHDPGSDSAPATFKEVLHLAKEASSSLDFHGNKMESSTNTSDSGFAALQWWASVGLVAWYWLVGEDSTAEEHYPAIEALSGDSTPVATVLQLAFKTGRLQRRPPTSVETPINVLLQLCETTALSLKNCVTTVLQDHSDCVENELHQLGLLLACDWLLEVRIKLWETHGKDSFVTRENTPGFYQDVESLSQLATLLPTALSRVRLYKGCYQLMAGANPMKAQSMLSSTGRASFLRRRGQTKDPSTLENPALYSPEHAMAKLLAYKHLPPSLESPDSTTGDMVVGSYQGTESSAGRSHTAGTSSSPRGDSKQTQN